MLTAGESRGGDGTSATGAGTVLRLIRAGEAVTRADLARHTGLARSTVAQRVEALLAHQLVYEAGGSASTGGRPPTAPATHPPAGVGLRAHAAGRGPPPAPEEVLGWVHERFVALLDEVGRNLDDVRGIGIGVPAPVA